MTLETPPSAARTWWRRYLEFPLIWKLAIGLGAGVVAGLVVGPSIEEIKPLGDLFLRLLLMVVIPLVVATLIVGVSAITPAQLGRIGGKIFIFYMLTSTVAISLGLALAFVFNPGRGMSMPADDTEPAEAPSLAETLLNIVPQNPIEAMAEGRILAVVFGAVVAGLAIGSMRHSPVERVRDLGETLRKLAEAASEVMFRIVRGVLEYAPIGVFALIAVVVGQTGTDALRSLAELIGVVYGGVALQIGLYAVLLLLFGISVRRFFALARTPMLTAFVTRTSGGTLPVSTRAAQRMGVDESVYSFSLPFGATINMDGTALYIGASVVFIANVSGINLSIGEILGVVLVGVLASIGTAGVPGAGLIMLSLAVTQAGLPFAAVALVAGIDAVLDMVRTMCNVTGDLTGTRIVDRTESGTSDSGTSETGTPEVSRQPESSRQPDVTSESTLRG
ncbi:dicarboxylate/amino acid:cation symporter [Phytoactinopolyspora limicola]|uniref:dicarboxylate/amino acid:cation symporter n=1 Tax=Phytoactinopolyspora limicola TaxID=2715536 RepID=UPI00140D5C5D|nr:dicarboxylate/amino acid:cation symporter [Phytoactinopolyspora limicola]